VSQPPSVDRPVRRDAVRNRARLVDAATEAFRQEGLEVAVDEIARRAGVGVATLYRHFPAKGDLILAVTESFVEVLGEEAERVLAEGDGEGAFAAFMSAALTQQRQNQGFLEAIAQRGLEPAARAALADRLLALLVPIAAAAHAAGDLRPELDETDLLVALRMLGTASTTADGGRGPERYLDVLLRGLVAR
jgi:AcrR family transcriptional regulator